MEIFSWISNSATLPTQV